MSMPEDDALLPLKKRARRRLIGAVAMAVLAAVVLPMVMDPAPQAPVTDVEIRIPGQDQVPTFNPGKLTARSSEPERPVAAAPAASAAPPVTGGDEKSTEKARGRTAASDAAGSPPKAPEKPAAEPAELPAAKPAGQPVTKSAEKPPAEKPPQPATRAGDDEARRAAAILSGQSAPGKPVAAAEHVILIGAFANQGNVKLLQSKLGELGIKIYTEPLDSPQGRKTRVRAGPFPNREAAEKALEKMKRIGVNGVVATRQ